MTSTVIPTLPSSEQPQNSQLPHVVLIWRQKQLLVKRSWEYKQPYLPALESNQRLVKCLKNSPVRLVRVEPELGEASLKFWADACEQADKQIFVRIPTVNKALKQRNSSWVKRLINSIAAVILLMLLSPVMVALGLLIRIDSPGPIFYRQWHVGKRGQLFRVLRFRTTYVNNQKPYYEGLANHKSFFKREDASNVTQLGSWLRKYNLDKLPQLINVLRGEMSLIGSNPLILYDAVRLSPEAQRRLNALPGIISTSAVKARFQPDNSGAIPTL